MEMITNKKAVILDVDEPVALGFCNIFEVPGEDSDGDIWKKIVGCEGCPNIADCCGSCAMLTPIGCMVHLKSARRKPFRCIVSPTPGDHMSWCQQEFLCVQGIHKGKIRKVREPIDVFHEVT